MRLFYRASSFLLAFLVGFLAPVQQVQGQVEYPITVTTVLNDGTPLAVAGLVTPWGNNGIYSATPGDTVVYTFNGTSTYHLMDVVIDSVSQGPINHYTFYNVSGPHAIVVTYGECATVTNLTVSQVAGTSALVTWEDSSPDATINYTLQYRDITSSTWTSVYNITNTSYLLSGLNPLSDYEVRVWSFCGGNLEGDWVITQFHTTCLVGGDVRIGYGTNTLGDLPSFSLYNYSLTEQIFTAAELGRPNTFHSISFQASHVVDSTRAWDIYLMPTNLTSLTGLVSVDATAQLVFSGTVHITPGWFTINFDSSFVYDGYSNLMLIVDDNTGSYVNSSNSFYGGGNPNGNSIRVYQDNINFDPHNTSSYHGIGSSYRNNIIFGGICDTATCLMPNFTITNCTDSTIGITWVPGNNETTWNLCYKSANDTIWNYFYGLTGSNHTITGLNASTEYIIRLQAGCGSEWKALICRTACGEIFLPYREDFESGIITTSQNNFITCWDRHASNQYHYVYRSTQHNHTPGGSGALDFHNTPNCYTMAIMPAIHDSFPVSSLIMEFEAKRTGNMGTFVVGVISDIHNDSTFHAVDTIVFNSTNNWEHFIVSFDHYSGPGRNIAFRASGNISGDFVIDDLFISEISVCVHPSNLVCTGVGSNHITLDWTEMGNATSWIVEYGPPGFTPGQGNGTTEITTSHPYTIYGLPSNASYDFYVKSDCGYITSDFTGPFSAATGFFTMSVTGSDTLTTCGTIIYDNGGPNGNYSANCNNILVLLPETPGTMMMLTGTCNVENNYDHLYIYDGVGTGGTQLGSFGNSSLQNITVLSTTGPLTIHFTSDGSLQKPGFELFASCETCFPPSNINASNFTATTADLSWSGNASNYLVTVIGSDSNTFMVNGTATTLLNLVSDSHYRVFIRSICGTDTSFASPDFLFTTACSAITITESNPWTEDFESYPGSSYQPLLCWDTPVTTSLGLNTVPSVRCHYLPVCHSGQNSLELMGPKNLLVLPEFTNNVHDLRLFFWATSPYPSDCILEIGVITDVTDTSTFEPVATAPAPGHIGYNNVTSSGFGNYSGPIDFSGVTASDGRIAIRYTGVSQCNLDDFTVKLIPNCSSPVKNSVVVNSVSAYNATLSWTDNDPSHNSWTVYYKSSSDAVWSTTVSSSTTAQITGLTPETTYDAYVITNCAIGDLVPDATFTVSFTTTISCPAPTALSASGASPSTAILSWTENGTATAWEIEYSTSNFTPGTGVGTTVQATSNPFTVTGLSGNTHYVFYVRAVCAASDSSLWSNAASAVTLCDVVVVTSTSPFIENFDNVNSGLPACWSSISNTGNAPWAVVTNAAYSGSNSVQLYMDNQSVESSLQLPTLDISGLSNPILSFWYTHSGWSNGLVQVYYRPSPSDPWMHCKTLHLSSWQNITIPLYFPSSTFQIMFYGLSGYRQYVRLDDIVVMESNGPPPYITPPTVITQSISDITATSATLHGSVAPNGEPIIAQGFEWKESVGGTYTPVNVSGNTLTYNLTGLMANTNHTFRTFATTPSGTTYGTELNFITLNQEGTCPAPTNVFVDSITQTSAKISWTQEDGTASSWNFLYKESTVSNWNTLTTSDNPYTLTGLSPGTVYLVQVKARCHNGLMSDPSPAISFATLPDGISDYTLNNSVTLFPNPTSGVVQIKNEELRIKNLEVYDVYGKLLNVMSVNDHTADLDLSGYAKGTYFVRVITEKGVVTKRVVKN